MASVMVELAGACETVTSVIERDRARYLQHHCFGTRKIMKVILSVYLCLFLRAFSLFYVLL